jgi:hypothetical protein
MVLPDGSVLDFPAKGQSFAAGFLGWGMGPLDSQYADGCAVQVQSYWQNQVQFQFGPGIQNTFSQAVTYGTSASQTTTLSATVGATAGLSGDGASVGLSASLTESLADTVTISEQTTTTEQFQFPVNDSEWQVGAVYQLIQVFSLLPGANLVNGLAWAAAQDPAGPIAYAIPAPYLYPANVFDSTSAVVSSEDAGRMRPSMTAAEIAANPPFALTA